MPLFWGNLVNIRPRGLGQLQAFGPDFLRCRTDEILFSAHLAKFRWEERERCSRTYFVPAALLLCSSSAHGGTCAAVSDFDAAALHEMNLCRTNCGSWESLSQKYQILSRYGITDKDVLHEESQTLRECGFPARKVYSLVFMSSKIDIPFHLPSIKPTIIHSSGWKCV